eukprot:12425674-Heterocapsa_arctica.AAC.1
MVGLALESGDIGDGSSEVLADGTQCSPVPGKAGRLVQGDRYAARSGDPVWGGLLAWLAAWEIA